MIYNYMVLPIFNRIMRAYHQRHEMYHKVHTI